MSRRLQILFLTNRVPLPITDGQSRRTFHILKGLGTTHDVHLLSLYDPADAPSEHSVAGLKAVCREVELHPGPSKKLGFAMGARLLASVFSRDPYTVWRHWSRSYLRRIQELVRRSHFDVVHCDILPLAYTVDHLDRLPAMLTDHDISYLKAYRMARQSRNPLLRLFLSYEALKLKWLESRIFRQVRLGIAVSEVDKRTLEQLCPGSRIEVVENGVDTKEFSPAAMETDQDTLVWVGGFDNFPNREGMYFFLERVYPLVKARVEGVRINLVGGGVTRKLKDLSAADPTVNVLGYVDDPLPHIHRGAVFIVPILSGSGTRLKLLEAMAVAKATVTTSVGCEGIDGKNGEHYLVADDPEEFAEAVVSLLTDAAQRRRLGSNARTLAVRRYDWQLLNQKVDLICRTVAGAR